MTKFIIIYLLSILILSCTQKNKKTEIETPAFKIETKRIVNDKLLAFKTEYIAELGQKKYFKLEKEVNKGKIEDDSIKLKIDLISHEVCSSLII